MRLTTLLVAVYLGHSSVSLGDESPSAELLLSRFAQSWQEDAWEKSFRAGRPGYIRPLKDEGWKSRMDLLRGVANLGGESVEPLMDAIEKGDTPTRILAAQALGYVASAAREPGKLRAALLRTAEQDKDATVRLYSVDALGMQGGDLDDLLRPLLKTEKNRDVLRHIEYALERKGEPIESQIVESLAKFDRSAMGSAKVGKPAPSIRLTSVQGQDVQLSQFKGQKAVVLVFIYGDT